MPYASWIDKRNILHLQLIRLGARKNLFAVSASVNWSVFRNSRPTISLKKPISKYSSLSQTQKVRMYATNTTAC